ncbi:hypothetical protein [uncultured Sphingomonas sp.]|uniref:hypothetical protein n=1 Tax=uncultured Sphingomonas sp. TaxID=158754 RepID=UPI001576369C
MGRARTDDAQKAYTPTDHSHSPPRRDRCRGRDDDDPFILVKPTMLYGSKVDQSSGECQSRATMCCIWSSRGTRSGYLDDRFAECPQAVRDDLGGCVVRYWLVFDAILMSALHWRSMVATCHEIFEFVLAHEYMLAISATLTTLFLVLAVFRSLRRWALGGALLLMVAGTLFSALYVVGYEQGDRAGGDGGCNHQDQYPPGHSEAPVYSQPESAASDGTGTEDGGATGNPTEIAQLRIACQANGIMRGALHVQIATAVGGLLVSCMALVAAFVAVFEYLDRTESGASRRGGLVSRLADERGDVPRPRVINDRHGIVFSLWTMMGLATLLALRRVVARGSQSSDHASHPGHTDG